MGNPIVYSTGRGRMCPECGKPVPECVCAGAKPSKPLTALDGVVRVGRETKGRKGKGVTVITGVPLDDTGLRALGKELKARCGAGGTVKDGTIEIQGEHRDLILEELQKRGWKVKRSGN